MRNYLQTIVGSKWWRATALGVWLTSFEHAAMATPGEPSATERGVSLAELVRVAAERAPALRVPLARERAASRERAALPSALYDPVLGVEAGPRRRADGETDYDLGVSLLQPVEVAGEAGLRRELAGRRAQAARAESALLRFQLLRELELDYRRAQIARELVQLGARGAAVADDLRAVAERRRALGEGSLIEVRFAEADALDARREQARAVQDLNAARVRLGARSGWPGEVTPPPSDALPALPSLPPLEGLLTQAAAAHPELVRQGRRLEAAETEARLAARSAWPVPVFGASIVREGSPAGEPELIVLGSVSVPVPLFRQNAVERARADAEQALVRAELTTERAALRMRLREAHAELAGALERHRLLSESAAALAAALELARRGFEAGELELATVAAARERWFGAEHTRLEARLEAERALAELQVAFGRELPRAAALGEAR